MNTEEQEVLASSGSNMSMEQQQGVPASSASIPQYAFGVFDKELQKLEFTGWGSYEKALLEAGEAQAEEYLDSEEHLWLVGINVEKVLKESQGRTQVYMDAETDMLAVRGRVPQKAVIMYIRPNNVFSLQTSFAEYNILLDRENLPDVWFGRHPILARCGVAALHFPGVENENNELLFRQLREGVLTVVSSVESVPSNLSRCIVLLDDVSVALNAACEKLVTHGAEAILVSESAGSEVKVQVKTSGGRGVRQVAAWREKEMEQNGGLQVSNFHDIKVNIPVFQLTDVSCDKLKQPQMQIDVSVVAGSCEIVETTPAASEDFYDANENATTAYAHVDLPSNPPTKPEASWGGATASTSAEWKNNNASANDSWNNNGWWDDSYKKDSWSRDGNVYSAYKSGSHEEELRSLPSAKEVADKLHMYFFKF